MRSLWCIAAAVFQLLVLGYIAGEREWIIRTGQIIHLRTAPIDPNDPMRGAYVRLNYSISTVARSQCHDGLADTNMPGHELKRDLPVYAVLDLDETGFGELKYLTDRRPIAGVFLRGRLERSWDATLRVRYGLEAFFMQQEKAAEVERERWQERRDVAMIVDVAVGANGTGALKSHRWDTLGITLNLLPAGRERSASTRTNPPTTAEVILKNHGKTDLALVDLPGNRSFALVVDESWRATDWRWTGSELQRPAPRPEDVIVLKPDQSHTNRIEFRETAWFVASTGTNSAPRSISTLRDDWSTRFRLEYRPPSGEACKDLSGAALIWHGRLPSRAFRPTMGGID